MLITKASGIVAPVVRAKEYHIGTALQLVGEEATLAAMTDITIEVPSDDFEPQNMDSYSGGWTALKCNGSTIVLNADNMAYKFEASMVCRVNKHVDEQVGVAWVW